MIIALASAAVSTVVFYTGMALARRTPSKLYAALFRLGGLLLGIILSGLIPMILEASLMTAERAGRYSFYMMLGGAFVYKLLLVRFIPLPQKQSDAQST